MCHSRVCILVPERTESTLTSAGAHIITDRVTVNIHGVDSTAHIRLSTCPHSVIESLSCQSCTMVHSGVIRVHALLGLITKFSCFLILNSSIFPNMLCPVCETRLVSNSISYVAKVIR